MRIKKLFNTKVISFDSLKNGLEKYPLIRYRSNAILMTDNNVMIKFDFTSITASILFLETLLEECGETLPNSQYLRSVVLNQMGMKTTKETPEECIRRKIISEGF